MLYVSTRNISETYTAYRALHEARTPDGGFFVPFYLPEFTTEEIAIMRSQSFVDVIARILNLFFGVGLSGWDVECAVGSTPVKMTALNQRLTVAEAWHNPDGSFRYLQNSLYKKMTGKNNVPAGWPYVAIKIAMLFGLFTTIEDKQADFDIAATTGDFADLTAVFYAKEMGLPINMTICACNESCPVWDLTNRGVFSTNANVEVLTFMECFLFKCFGAESAKQYVSACKARESFQIDEGQLEEISSQMFSAVISTNRVDTIISSMYRSNQYSIDPYTAYGYGGLQDYRAKTGINKDTILLSKLRPHRVKE